ncbi:MAG: phosphatidylinositol-specific phospholipase C1-like protein [Verrucomicrobia subdivision 3 bacterium]|nr:phosphatidylinositol-specific phospholipase C1-like protein [Verrucomicrobiota bacterium]MCC6819401.1 phosphatidylinositol-specific phospholipase C1-like protein [Limisphaerales bacterium]
MLTGCSTPSPTAGLRLNQIQVIGTHNSYHLRGHDSLLALIAQVNPNARREVDYGHRPLPEQLAQLGIRQIELDCYADPDGGRYATPLGLARVVQAGLPPVPDPDPTGRLRAPGIKVMHVPDIDFASSALTLVDALRRVREWSVKHPRHVPVFIMLELKEDALGPGFTQPAPFDQAQLANLESEIRSVFPREAILTPDDVRGQSATLPEVLRHSGWPSLDSVRGRVMFGMDNEDAVRDRYLEGHPALEGRLLFVSVPATHPAAAWMKRNDPVGDFERIQELVRNGFMVRTRADSDTAEARTNDPRKREQALASGAQFVSTDYPEPDLRFSAYCVRLPDGVIARPNPVNGPANERCQKLE